MAGLKRQTCYNHPDRYGHAVCMSCRKTVCQECATEWDGINHCVACLASRRKASDPKSSVLPLVFVLAVCGLLMTIAPRLMVWGTTLFLR